MGEHRAPTVIPPWLAGNLLDGGEETLPRELTTAVTIPSTSGLLRLTYLTARKTEPVNNLRAVSGSTAAGATPTLARLGLYSIAANESGTLVCATDATDLTLFAVANTGYTRVTTTTGQKIAGQRYAFASIVVTAAAAPTLSGHAFGGSTETGVAPRLAAAITGLTDLPASFVIGSLIASGHRPYGAVMP